MSFLTDRRNNKRGLLVCMFKGAFKRLSSGSLLQCGCGSFYPFSRVDEDLLMRINLKTPFSNLPGAAWTQSHTYAVIIDTLTDCKRLLKFETARRDLIHTCTGICNSRFQFV